ncbi:hypothetical protein HOY82DRAFT_538486 [Tuber indicum]|nr:hypothetical protein HOY82DRAFT_538486 [Tuber indicum]
MFQKPDLHNWKLENSDLLEAKGIQFEYNFLSKRFVIKCMPMATHDFLQEFFIKNVFGVLVERVGFSQANCLVNIGSSTTFTGFKGDWTGSSEKQPDMFVKPIRSEFPTIVCEAGWSEKLEDLMADAYLWLLHTEGITKLVINVADTDDSKPLDPALSVVPSVLDRVRTMEDENVSSLDGLGGLRQSLTIWRGVGDLKVTIHLYQECENWADIRETVSATIIPAPSLESEVPKEFKITFTDIFRDYIPVGVEPTNNIIFSLAELRKFVTRSLQDTEQVRATHRVKQLLKEAGEWEETDTFTQHERRRQGGGSLLKEAGGWEETDTFTQCKRRRQSGGSGSKYLTFAV